MTGERLPLPKPRDVAEEKIHEIYYKCCSIKAEERPSFGDVLVLLSQATLTLQSMSQSADHDPPHSSNGMSSGELDMHFDEKEFATPIRAPRRNISGYAEGSVIEVETPRWNDEDRSGDNQSSQRSVEFHTFARTYSLYSSHSSGELLKDVQHSTAETPTDDAYQTPTGPGTPSSPPRRPVVKDASFTEGSRRRRQRPPPPIESPSQPTSELTRSQQEKLEMEKADEFHKLFAAT